MSDVVEMCSELIRIDTSNPGKQERPAADYVAGKLAEVGVEPTMVECAPGRTAVIARVEGADTSRDALLVHGHLDVVPADAADWQVDPFSGEVIDGYVWGRGAVDMKDMVAMTLETVRGFMQSGRKPSRDVVLAFFPDEEAGGHEGAAIVARDHRHHFDGVTEAIGEVGGFSVTVAPDLRLYLIETAQKGMTWMKLTAHGRAGHGSMLNDDNAVTALAEAVARLGRTRLPIHLTQTLRAFLTELGDALEIEIDLDDPETAIAKLGPISRMIGATIRNTANPTMLEAGYKVNVIPQTATAQVDGRPLPGFEAEFESELDDVLGPDITREVTNGQRPLETTFDGALVEAMSNALRAEDPGARPVPYLLSGGTDAKHLTPLGIRCFGFSPLRLPADLDFSAMFHGVDERVPVESLEFGVRVLDRFLSTA
ncbi:MAG TPA: M20/M25/M40 family metallo-hydrolase [Mycobacteriales bacterium]|nr:M20/M25/M40 family metallo-hydrolase [Mycobacteriales bacterium]